MNRKGNPMTAAYLRSSLTSDVFPMPPGPTIEIIGGDNAPAHRLVKSLHSFRRFTMFGSNEELGDGHRISRVSLGSAIPSFDRSHRCKFSKSLSPSKGLKICHDLKSRGTSSKSVESIRARRNRFCARSE